MGSKGKLESLPKVESFGATKRAEPNSHYIDWTHTGGSGYFFPKGLTKSEKLLRMADGASNWDRPFYDSDSVMGLVYVPQSDGSFKTFEPDGPFIDFSTQPKSYDPRPRWDQIAIDVSVPTTGKTIYPRSSMKLYEMRGLPESPKIETKPLSYAMTRPSLPKPETKKESIDLGVRKPPVDMRSVRKIKPLAPLGRPNAPKAEYNGR